MAANFKGALRPPRFVCILSFFQFSRYFTCEWSRASGRATDDAALETMTIGARELNIAVNALRPATKERFAVEQILSKGALFFFVSQLVTVLHSLLARTRKDQKI